MPELPEVETTVRDLRPHLIGHAITGAAVHWQRTIAHPTKRAFTRDIVGYRIQDITRRGKYLVFHLQQATKDGVQETEDGRRKTEDKGRRTEETQSPTAARTPLEETHRAAEKAAEYGAGAAPPPPKFLLVHLRMTGSFRFHQPEEEREKHVHVALKLDDGRELRFRDPRKFGRMWLVDDPELVTGKLGPEPFTITRRAFEKRIRQRRGRLKPLLLNQAFLAGVGNIYADESLWNSRLHPLREVSTLTDDEIGALYNAIRRVLKKAIGVGGTSIDINYRRINGMSGMFQEDLSVVGREGESCYRCGTPIVKTVVGQRGTYYCPNCQRLPK